MNILVIAAHPDDEVLGCGGTVARLAAEKHDVFIAILGEGITSRYANRLDADPEAVQVLRKRSQEVARMLGARDLAMFSLPDNRFDTVPLLDVVKIIEDLIARWAPQVVYTQHGGDLNVDHAVTFRATMTATRPMKGCSVRAVYAYEVASSTEWAFQQFSPPFRPNVFVDISTTLALKMKAMEAYESEVRAFPHPRSSAALQANAQKWGSVVGASAVEAFELIRSIQ
jgi:LmbE family N-acetylglucosaminyl deacetylase